MIKRVLLAVMIAGVVCAFGAATGPTALAVKWKVEGKELKTGEKAEFGLKGKVLKDFTFQAAGNVVTCTGDSSEKSYIEGLTGGGAAAGELSGCTSGEGCEVGTGGKIKTRAVTYELEAGSPIKLKIKPKEGKSFGVVSVCGPESVVTGSIVAELPEGETEKVGHVLRFTTKSGTELTSFSEEVSMTGEVEDILASEKKWSA